jgi:AraC-like DNA-binding protein
MSAILAESVRLRHTQNGKSMSFCAVAQAAGGAMSRRPSPPMRVIKQRFRRPQLAAPGVRVRPVFDDFHFLRMEGSYEYPRHQHTNYEVILVDRGPYRCELNGAELTLLAGQVLVVKPGDWHQDHLRDSQRHHVLHFRLGPAAPGEPPMHLFRAGVRPARQICTGNYAHDRLFMRELQHEAEASAAYAPAIQDSLLEALFWRIVRGLSADALSEAFRRLPEVEAQRSRLALVFEEHLQANPTVAELAAAAGMSSRHFTMRCRRLFGEAPARFLLRLKLRRAEEMLRHRGLRVKEVSEALGFTNPFHFSRVFKRVLGHPPSRG